MDRTDALLNLLRYLKQHDYDFTAVTPATHARVVARKAPDAPTLRDIFGWNRPFRPDRAAAELVALMRQAGILSQGSDGCRSELRVASLEGALFFHSPFPTDDADAVFFGPDTYRFVRFAKQHASGLVATRIIDMGAGTGAGGIALARLYPAAAVTLVDTNRTALDLAAVNARVAGVAVELIQDGCIPAGADLIIANPPYMMDGPGRAYRDGGDDLLGGDVSLAWVRDALAKLAPGGSMLLYTGAAYAAGSSPFLEALAQTCGDAGAALSLQELDPDVFGEELCEPAYAVVERIAAVGAVIRISG